jgi:conserved protein with predicted RNA binding PUA domain
VLCEIRKLRFSKIELSSLEFVIQKLVAEKSRKATGGHSPRSKKEEFSRSKFAMTLDYIFDKGASTKIDYSKLEFQYSRRTGRIKQVVEKSTKQILFTFRPNGSIAPTVAGATLLLSRKKESFSNRMNSRPRWTVTIINGVSEFISRGRTVFCKHVIHCSESLRAGQDVAVLNEDGKLLAVGRAVLAGPLMKQFKRGVAVKVREGTV